MNKVYYSLDIDLVGKKIVDYRETDTATLTGDTDNLNVHRIFLTKGQYKKLKNKLQLCTK